MARAIGRKKYIATRRLKVGRDVSDLLGALLEKHHTLLTSITKKSWWVDYREKFGFDTETELVWAVRWLCENKLIFLLEEIMGFDWLDDFHKHPETGMLRIYEKAQQSGKYPRILNMWPRGYGKSTYMTVGSNIQRILKNPEMRIGIGAWRVDLAERFVFQIGQELSGNDYLRELYPDVIWDSPKQSPRWNTSGLQVIRESRDKDPSIMPFSIFNLPIGSHMNALFLDDIVTSNNADSDTLQDSVKSALNQVSNLLTVHSDPIHWIGTVYSYNDAVNKAQDDPKWLLLKRTCWVDGKEWEVASSPTRFPVETLKQKYKDDGPYSFAANMELNPVLAEDRVLKAEWLKEVKHTPDGLDLYIGVDLAFTSKKHSDRTAIMVGGIPASRTRLYLVDGVLLQAGIEESIEYLVSIAKQYEHHCIMIGIELISGALGIEPMIRRAMDEADVRTPLKIISGYARTSASKEVRIESYLAPLMSRGDLVVTDRFKNSRPNMELNPYKEFIREIDRFKFKGHDDILDAIVDLLIVMPKLQTTTDNHHPKKKNLDRKDFIANLISKGKQTRRMRRAPHRRQ